MLDTIHVRCPGCSFPFKTHDGGDVTYCPRCNERFDKHGHRTVKVTHDGADG